MENKKPCLSPELEAVITILVAACLLLCIASNNMLLALPLVLGMAFLKKHAMRCYDRKLDKNYRGEIDEKFLDILLLIILRSPRRLSS